VGTTADRHAACGQQAMKAGSAASGRVAVRADHCSPGPELAQSEGLLGLPARGHAAARVAGTPVAGDQDGAGDRGGHQDELGDRDARVHRDGSGDPVQLVGRHTASWVAMQESTENVDDHLGAVRPHPSVAPQRRGEPETGETRQRDGDDGTADRGSGEFPPPAERVGIAATLGRRRNAPTVGRW
jgi:hypothetical protein